MVQGVMVQGIQGSITLRYGPADTCHGKIELRTPRLFFRSKKYKNNLT